MKQEKIQEKAQNKESGQQADYETKAAQDSTPVIPLPNPGEGGPVYPGMTDNTTQDNASRPVIPLPNPGEGGPVYPNNGYPNMGFPNIGGNNNSNNNNSGNTFPNLLPNIIGTIISTYPRPNEPCRFCPQNTTRTGTIRFLNAASGYNPFTVFVNENVFSNGLNFAEITDYEKVAAGNPVVTVMGDNGYVFIQKQIEVSQNELATVAIINTESGLDIQMIPDQGCDRAANMACVRAANLSYNSGALSVVIGNQYVNFPNLRYRSVADFESVWPGVYLYTVSRNMVARFPGFGNSVLLTAAIQMQRNRNYTIYLLNWNRDSSDTIKALIVEDN